MSRTKLLLSLVMAMLLVAAFGLSALGLDVELKGGGGLAMGTTDDSNKSGAVRYALDAGLALDLFLLQPGSMAFGITAGASYANLHFHGVWENYPDPIPPPGTSFTTQTSDSTYNYLLFPFGLAGKFGFGKRSLTVRAGGFVGYFLSGTSDLTYPTEVLPWWENGPTTLDDSNTELWMYGLSFYAGLDLFSWGKLSVVPSIQFDLGLSDTTVDLAYPPASKDTSWSLTANVGIRYSILK